MFSFCGGFWGLIEGIILWDLNGDFILFILLLLFEDKLIFCMWVICVWLVVIGSDVNWGDCLWCCIIKVLFLDDIKLIGRFIVLFVDVMKFVFGIIEEMMLWGVDVVFEYVIGIVCWVWMMLLDEVVIWMVFWGCIIGMM